DASTSVAGLAPALLLSVLRSDVARERSLDRRCRGTANHPAPDARFSRCAAVRYRVPRLRSRAARAVRSPAARAEATTRGFRRRPARRPAHAALSRPRRAGAGVRAQIRPVIGGSARGALPTVSRASSSRSRSGGGRRDGGARRPCRQHVHGKHHPGGSRRWRDANVDTVTVRQVALDDVVAERGLVPDLVKIDTEGAELTVLRGAVEVLRAA